MNTNEHHQKNKAKGIPIIILGIIFLGGGLISFLYGNSKNNIYNDLFLDQIQNSGFTFNFLGIIGLLLGIILLIVGIAFYCINKNDISSSNNFAAETEKYNPIDDIMRNLIELKSKNLITDEEFIKKYQNLAISKHSVNIRTCDSCKAQVKNTDIFCSVCGHKLEDEKSLL